VPNVAQIVNYQNFKALLSQFLVPVFLQRIRASAGLLELDEYRAAFPECQGIRNAVLARLDKVDNLPSPFLQLPGAALFAG